MIFMAENKYFIITPVRNEAENLPQLIQSVVNQTIKPLLWVLVDDGSTDDSRSIIREMQKKYDCIQYIQLPKHQRDLGKHYAHVCNKGFDFSAEYFKDHSLEYEYLGIVDADVILEKEFFEKLIAQFKMDSTLSTISGSMYSYKNGELTLDDIRDDVLIGSARLWRKKAFENFGGFPLSYSSDTVSDVLAKLNGWKVLRLKNAVAIQTRKISSAEGLWRGYKINGMSAYFRNYHPFFVLAISFNKTLRWPHYTGLAYLFGYLNSALNRMEKIDNEDVKNYYYYNKHKEAVNIYLDKIRRKFK